MRIYTKEQKEKIVELFNNKTDQKKIEAYAKSIGKSYDAIYQKYHKIKSGKNPSKVSKPYKDDQKEFIMENWPIMNIQQRKKYVKSIGRSYSAVEKVYYKEKPRKKFDSKLKKAVVENQKPATIKVTHINEPIEKQKAIAYIGTVRIEIPSNTLTIGEIKLEW